MTDKKFLKYEEIAEIFAGKTVALVGSGPSVMQSDGEHIDSHDLVVRVNNYKTGPLHEKTGKRTDVHYAFYGTSIRKTKEELMNDGVKYCMCKCPDASLYQDVDCSWHIRNHKELGVDYRYIYTKRQDFWFCPTYVPTKERFLKYMHIMDGTAHQPTTGFSAILDLLSFQCRSVYVTGFDFFTSRIHNVNEAWNEKNLDDPLRHRPDLECRFLATHRPKNWVFDPVMVGMLDAAEKL